jgi:basic membrane protein A
MALTATDNDRIAAYNLAVQNGAEIVVAPGYLQATAMRTVAQAHTDVKFVFVDGWSLTDSVDDKGYDNGTALKNVTAITYKEQEAGYFAGYGAAMDGFTKLGGTFGGGGTNPACERYAWGYVQGIEAGATAKGVTGKLEVKISYKYGSTFSGSSDLVTQIGGWYSAGTEIVFACGGSMFGSVVSAAGNNANRWIIGVDVDQASLSNSRPITSAMKGLGCFCSKDFRSILRQHLEHADLAAKTQNLGAADDATGLPTATASWRFRTFNC